MLRAPSRNSDGLETVSMSGQFQELNTHSVGHWYKLDRLEMSSRMGLFVSTSVRTSSLAHWTIVLRNVFYGFCLKLCQELGRAHLQNGKGCKGWWDHARHLCAVYVPRSSHRRRCSEDLFCGNGYSRWMFFWDEPVRAVDCLHPRYVCLVY
jgi:hypothetical protein